VGKPVISNRQTIQVPGVFRKMSLINSDPLSDVQLLAAVKGIKERIERVLKANALNFTPGFNVSGQLKDGTL